MKNIKSNDFKYQGNIAVIGMACKFPQSNNVDEYWENIKNGKECIRFFDKKSGGSDFNQDSSHHVDANGYLEGVELFDAQFFGYSPREAETMDPQSRIFLELVYEALEVSGYCPENYPGSIGLFAGSNRSTYFFNYLWPDKRLIQDVGLHQLLIGNEKDHLTSRVAYKLNLKGPCLAVNTTCSTSLVAVHLACQNLLDFQCDIALAGGINISVPQDKGYTFTPGGILSPDGHCRAFDEKAMGTIFGNGGGVVVLKRFEDAVRDGDQIEAVIRGSAVNNDGAFKLGYTAPSIDGQAAAIMKAHEQANVDVESISYIEAHGTATNLGDPIEIAALTKAFNVKTKKRNYCSIGSVKTNIGHLNSASGIAGFIKVVLSLKNKQLPPSINFEKPNKNINFKESPFVVNVKLVNWDSNGKRRIAGINSFGFGGTNAHVILEEAPQSADSMEDTPWKILLLSARTESALIQYADKIQKFLSKNGAANLSDLAFTSQVGRKSFEFRKHLVFKGSADLSNLLDGFIIDPCSIESKSIASKRVVYLFPGQGAQHVGMFREIYKHEAFFRNEFDKCSKILKSKIDLNLSEILFSSSIDTLFIEDTIHKTAVTQPLLFSLEYALAKLLMHWGVLPSAMIGHSLGEYVAACLAGVFSLEKALSIVSYRGEIVQELSNGLMLSLEIKEEELMAILTDGVAVAAVNGPNLCVVSGEIPIIRQFEQVLRNKQISFQELSSSHAFHSNMLDPVLEKYEKFLRNAGLEKPEIAFISGFSGDWIKDEASQPEYWASHLRHTVQFDKGIKTLVKNNYNFFIEVGPGNVLTSMLNNRKNDEDLFVLSTLGNRNSKNFAELQHLYQCVGKLWQNGINVNWQNFHSNEKRRRIKLPTYPFERTRYWHDSNKGKTSLQIVTPAENDFTRRVQLPSWKALHPLSLLKNQKIDKELYWLVFTDNLGLGDAIKSILNLHSIKQIVISPGPEFKMDAQFFFTIDPGKKDHLDQLFALLKQNNLQFGNVLHLLNYNTFTKKQSLDANLKGNLANSFYNILFMVQSISNFFITEKIKISLVSNFTRDVFGNEKLLPLKTMSASFSKVVSKELPNISFRNIDVSIDTKAMQLADLLVKEVLYGVGSDIALRNNKRWEPSFEELTLHKAGEIKGIKENGSYLITGGRGGIGLVIAKYMIEKYNAKIALIGRSHLPENESVIPGIENNDHLIYIQSDVTDLKSLKNAVKKIKTKFGEINGVVHSAGIAGGGIIQLKRTEDAEKVFAAKIAGTYNLYEVIKNQNVDFLLLCSSTAAINGTAGQIDYTAANMFLDSFSNQNRQEKSVRTISINWPLWKEVGMGVVTAVPGKMAADRQAAIDRGLSSDEGAKIFEMVTNHTFPQVVILNEGSRIEQSAGLPGGSLSGCKTNNEEKRTVSYKRPNLSNHFDAPKSSTEITLAKIWENLFGIEQIGVNDDFFELGGHSLMAAKLMSRTCDAFNITLPLRALFEGPTIADLANEVVKYKIANSDTDLINDMLAQIDNLTEQEAQELLNKRG